MKNLLLFVLGCLPVLVFGQIWEQHFIGACNQASMNMYSIDIDNDGDVDIFFSCIETNSISWYENDGNGNFINQHIIDTGLGFENTSYYDYENNIIISGDLNKDANLDIVLSFFDGEEIHILWYEGDGNGNFQGPQSLLSEFDNYVYSIYMKVYDIDDDQDDDILFSYNDKLFWLENDGIGNFERTREEEKAIIDGQLVDINKDGRTDILMTTGNKIELYINKEDGDFQIIVIDSSESIPAVHAADLDNDGLEDIIAFMSVEFKQKILWYKNNGNNDFDAPILMGQVEIGYGPYYQLYSSDVNNDGNMDILYTSLLGTLPLDTPFIFDYSTNELGWYKNNGDSGFSEANIIDFTNRSVEEYELKNFAYFYPTDIDGDSDLDIFYFYNHFTPSEGTKLVWFENQATTSTEQILVSENINIYPNPFQESLTFQLEQAGTYQVQIFDARGRLLQQENIQEREYQLSTKGLLNGLYFYQVKNGSGVLVASGKLVKN